MPAWLDRTVDRLNAQLVRLRVGRRTARDPRDDADIVAQLHRARLESLERVVARSDLSPAAADTRAGFETWRSPGTDWSAQRLPAASSGGVSLVVLHGWLAVDLQIRLLRWSLRALPRAGVDVWFPWLPLHGPRTPPGAVSGERFLSADLARTAAAVEQSVGETVALVRWLRSRGERVALVGVSLGGWVGALTATVPSELDRVLLWTPVVDPADALTHSPLAAHLRHAVRLDALPPADVESFLRPLAPLHRERSIASERVLVLGALHDNVVSTTSLNEFARRWDAHLEWVPRGHISAQWSRRCRRMVTKTVLALLLSVRR